MLVEVPTKSFLGMRLQTTSRLNEKNGPKAYQVHRWRIDTNDQPQQISATAKADKEGPHSVTGGSENHLLETLPRSQSTLGLKINPTASGQSLPADNLLHLIHYNTFRGLYNNKIILGTATVSWEPETLPDLFDKAFPSFSVVLPFAPGLPSNLSPSESQMNIVHSTWIDLIPFAAMRENLIRWETCFDHVAFARDLVGNVADPELFPQPRYSRIATPVRDKYSLSGDEDDDEVTANRNGLILWGESHDVDSWEVTPGFLRKWAWVMQGCEELIVSSNRWRRIRGEEPLHFSIGVEDLK